MLEEEAERPETFTSIYATIKKSILYGEYLESLGKSLLKTLRVK